MTRRLPWKTSSTRASPTRSNQAQPESPLPKVSKSPGAPATPAPPSHTPLKRTRREREIDPDDGIRSPSTSPPPEVPVERFMIPLLDDRYRMVEDEFLNIAHQFTTNLHRAEYNRLKNLAKAQNAATIQEIERPVVGTPTLLAQQRKEEARRVSRQRKASDVHGDENGRSLPRAETGLRGLLESPRKEAKWIAASASGTATTRAAAGFSSNLSSPPKPRSSPNLFSSSRKRQLPAKDDDESDEGDDDLATPCRSRFMKSTRVTQSASSATSRSTTWPINTPRAAGSSSTTNSPRPPPSASRLAATPSKIVTSRVQHNPPRKNNSHHQDSDEEDEDDDPFGINKRRMIRQKSREQFRKTEPRPPPKKSSHDNIPSFI